MDSEVINHEKLVELKMKQEIAKITSDQYYLVFLQQYIYDSSTVRKRIFQEALVSITLPFIKKTLVPSCKPVRVSLFHSFTVSTTHTLLWGDNVSRAPKAIDSPALYHQLL